MFHTSFEIFYFFVAFGFRIVYNFLIVNGRNVSYGFFN